MCRELSRVARASIRAAALIATTATVTVAVAVPLAATTVPTRSVAVVGIGLAVAARTLLTNGEVGERTRHNGCLTFDARELCANQLSMAPTERGRLWFSYCDGFTFYGMSEWTIGRTGEGSGDRRDNFLCGHHVGSDWRVVYGLRSFI